MILNGNLLLLNYYLLYLIKKLIKFLVTYIKCSAESMWIRSCLAALDWNENCNRKQQFDKNGEPRVRVKVFYSIISQLYLVCKYVFLVSLHHVIFQINRARTKRTIQRVMEPKDYSLKYNIVNDVMTAFRSEMVPDVKIPDCGGKVSTPAVSRKELIEKHTSRMH